MLVSCRFEPRRWAVCGRGGTSDFYVRSRELAGSGESAYVLLADIADFYNQVSLHRVENALESAGVARQRANNIENFLTQLNGGQSRGIPVGPPASTLLAETCLHDVDMFLLGRACPHVRYVDDFRIFCRSKREAIAIRHDLTDYLHTVHRLSLESSKTKIVSARRFTSQIDDPAQQEKKAGVAKLEELIGRFREATGYNLDVDDLSPRDRSTAVRKSLVELFEHCVSTKPLHLGLARHLLRRARQLRTAALIPLTFQYIEALTPAFRDAALYIATCLPRRKQEETRRGEELVGFLDRGDYGTLPFIRTWGLELMDKRPAMIPADEAVRVAAESASTLGLRETAMVARRNKQLDWVRKQKEIWKNNGPWDKRAIIWCSCILPKGERRHWLSLVERGGDVLDRAVAQFAANEA